MAPLATVEDRIVARRREGASFPTLRAEFGFSGGRISRILRERLEDDERSAITRTVWADRLESQRARRAERDERVVACRRDGWTYKAISAEFGLSGGQISQILRAHIDAAARRQIDHAVRVATLERLGVVGDGKLSLSKAARESGVSQQALRDAVERGDVRAQRIVRGSRVDFDLDPTQLDDDLAKLPCRLPGCDRPGLGPSACCSPAHAAKVLETGKPRPAEVVERITATKRTLEAGIRAAMEGEGLATLRTAAELLYWCPDTLRESGKVSLERRTFGRMVRLGVNARSILHAAPDGRTRQRLSGPLAKPLSALKGTVYAPHAVEVTRPGLTAAIIERHDAGKSVRTIGTELGVSKSHVQRVIARRTKTRAQPHTVPDP